MLRIKQDHARFKGIVHGQIKAHLKQYISKGEMIGKQGGEHISIPVPQIDLPHFRFGNSTGGVGQGAGVVGDVLKPGDVQDGGTGGVGNQTAEHSLETDVSYDELANMLGEVLELPHIKPRGSDAISTEQHRFVGVQRNGPDSLRHFKRTYKQALRRSLMLGNYNQKTPLIVPSHEDRRYRSWKVKNKPETNAVIIYMMDVSGSMGDEQKEIVRIETFWIDVWLRSQYKGLKTRYIIHDAVAKEVDKDVFFHTRESGGTMISSAYKLCADIIAADYQTTDYNIYPFHFSDGDNWSADDTHLCLDILSKKLLPVVNAFCYGQVESPYGSGQFIKDLKNSYYEEAHLITSEIPNKEAIERSIKDFLGKGL